MKKIYYIFIVLTVIIVTGLAFVLSETSTHTGDGHSYNASVLKEYG